MAKHFAMALEGSPCSYLKREIRMVLVGKTGVGKSETGNTICGAGRQANIFGASARAMSVTKESKKHSFTRFGYDLQLVEFPSCFDTSRSPEDIKQEVMKCLGMSSPGVHAFLFIVRIGRFTEEDKTTLEKFLQCIGEEAKRFVIVVFTGKDDLEEAGDTIDNYIADIPTRLKQFLSDTSLRFIAVNNRGTDEEKEKFTKDLIDKVNNIVDENGGQCFTNDMYERCEADLREAEKNEKLEGKRQKEIEGKRRQETAAWEEQLQSQRDKIQEMEKELEKERTSWKKDKEDQLIYERLKPVELRVKNEEENKRREEEKKRQAEQKEAEENMSREFEMMKDYQRNLTEKYEQKIEELRLEKTRKQICNKFENGDIGYLRQFWQWFSSWFHW